MSRTKRRVHSHHQDSWWILRDWDYTDGYRLIQIDPRSKEGRKRLARYHSDAQRTMSGPAPAWYCNIFQKSARQEARRQLHLFFKNPEDIDRNQGFMVQIDPKHHHNATWSWW